MIALIKFTNVLTKFFNKKTYKIAFDPSFEYRRIGDHERMSLAVSNAFPCFSGFETKPGKCFFGYNHVFIYKKYSKMN